MPWSYRGFGETSGLFMVHGLGALPLRCLCGPPSYACFLSGPLGCGEVRYQGELTVAVSLLHSRMTNPSFGEAHAT